MSKYLDNNGLLYFWQKLKTALGTKVDAVAGKGLSTNDYTTAEKTKLAGIEASANAYAHPAYTSRTSALYKVTVDSQGHVSGATAAAKADITALGIPGQDTTYSAATTGAAGLMAAADKSKLDGISAGANAYAHPAGDGNRHVPATGTANNGKFLRAGSTAASEAWGALAASDVTGALGYTPPTPAQLAAKATVQQYAATLLAGSWSGAGPYTQAVTVSGILATDTPLVDLVQSDTVSTAQAQLEAYGYISRIDTQAGGILATCYDDKPGVDLTLALKGVR